MTNPSDVQLYDLDDCWADSVGDPLALLASDDPQVQAGSYVIRPGERVPETGTTSHGGPELSVILSGEAILGLPDAGEEYVAGPGTFITIPAGVEHYSENRADDPVELVYTVVGDL
ncbi:cupin domain-containing protein [Halegenticoccus tardaugens]|uniref:cupin domain-containing protein n=1 Tax=Halegenticoccus tardaugens TaxID=2071624 RepID=UPI00100A2F9B|nr:cupin domain-containing protein [Halegenticoccus tardaugens]